VEGTVGGRLGFLGVRGFMLQIWGLFVKIYKGEVGKYFIDSSVVLEDF
jgi:hypothetical protein